MISVCIATYNGATYIKRQLETIISQLSAEDEIVISDDGSTDGTLEIVQDMESPLIKIYHNTGSHGYTPNFENALAHAKGDIIFLSDQDDVWVENKVAVCLRYLETSDFVVSDAMLIDEKEEFLADSFYRIRKPYRTLTGNILKFGYLGCCMAFRRDILRIALPFPKKRRHCTHDNWLFLVAKTFFRVTIAEEKLIKYRRHSLNASSGGIKDETTLLFKVSYRIYLIWNLVLCKLLRR